uniref:Uncharacterized protein n=1 Tax=Panagrolaimus davidi TaxID=227884 RepID=A0A914PA06_9BILA
MKIDPEISSLKSLIAILKSEVSNDHSKIEKLESEIQELKFDHKNVVPNKNDNNFDVSTEDDENEDGNEKSEAIRSSRNKAAIVFKKIDESKKQQQQKEESKTGAESCPARKLFYSNEGDIQVRVKKFALDLQNFLWQKKTDKETVRHDYGIFEK